MSTIELWEIEAWIYERQQRLLNAQRQAFKHARPIISKDKQISDMYKCESNNEYGKAIGFGFNPKDAYNNWWIRYQETKTKWKIETNAFPKRKWYQLWKVL